MAEGRIRIKKPSEVRKMRQAGEVACDILQRTAKEVKPGVTTKDVEDYAVELMKEHGCKSEFYGYKSSHGVKFPGKICISLNQEVVHGIANPNRRIQYGDIVKIDVGIRKDGFVGDNATTIPVGDIDPKTRHLLWATEESLHVAIDFAREGFRLGDLCSSVDRLVRGYGYSVVEEFVGHGVGRKLHEPPQIPNHGVPGDGPRIRAGMIFAIEPMVNLGTKQVKMLDDQWTVETLDGAPSAHFEHSVLITKGEPEILTPRPRLYPNPVPFPGKENAAPVSA